MSAIIGHHLHFSFSDMLEMTMLEMEHFYNMVKNIDSEK